jgi:hypothetical protein
MVSLVNTPAETIKDANSANSTHLEEHFIVSDAYAKIYYVISLNNKASP